MQKQILSIIINNIARKTTYRFWLMLIIFVIAAGIRFYGITWSAPIRYDMHPDEDQYIIGHAINISLHHLDPQFLNYPSFLIYLTAMANGIIHLFTSNCPICETFIAARAIVAIFGTLTALAAFLLAEEIGVGLLGAFLAGLWVAVLPLNVWNSHFAATDIPMTFWIILTIYASARLFRTQRLIDFIFVGITIGLGTASKYTAALVAIVPFITVIVAGIPKRTAIKGLIIAALTALVFAFIATPYSFIHLSETVKDMAYESSHVKSAHPGFSTTSATGFQYHLYRYELLAGWPFSMGIALYLTAISGLLWTILHCNAKRIPVLTFFFLFFGILGSWTFKPLRYTLPLVVLLAIFAGIWLESWLLSSNKKKKLTAIFIFSITLIYTSIFTFQTTDRFRHDTRIEAEKWLDNYMKPGQSILLCGYHYYLALPGDPRINVHGSRNNCVASPHNLTSFDLVEITSLHYSRYLRCKHNILRLAYKNFRHHPDFKLIKRFSSHFINKSFYEKLDPMFGGYFVSPTLEFYRYSPRYKQHPVQHNNLSRKS